jgi:tRNA pseudouridine38-40 synthase
LRIKLIIEYDGTGYCGWQRQKNHNSVQQTVEEALQTLTGKKTVLHAAGRTDAGVHALGQAAHFDTQAGIPPDKVAFALNALLPPDIRIRKSAKVKEGFHARFDAKKKRYRYVIQNSPHASAVLRNGSMHVPVPLDIKKMREAAAHLTGEHDFSAFTSAQLPLKNKVRTIYGIKIAKKGDIITIDVTGNGFLFNMVRIIAGTLIYVGQGKLSVEDIPPILASLDRRRAGVTAKPQGLFLAEVKYK